MEQDRRDRDTAACTADRPLAGRRCAPVDFDVVVEANCNSVVNRVEGETEIFAAREIRGELRRLQRSGGGLISMRGCCARPTSNKQRALMRQYETRYHRYRSARVSDAVGAIRMIPERSFVRGWKRSGPAISSTRTGPTSGWMRDQPGSRRWRCLNQCDGRDAALVSIRPRGFR